MSLHIPKRNTITTALVTGVVLPFAAAFYQPAQAQPTAAYFPEPVYVALQKSGAVEKFPSQTVYHGFPDAHYVSLGPNGKTMIVSGFKTGQAYIADATTGHKRATLHIGQVVQGVKIGPRGVYALAINASAGKVAVISLSKD